LTKEQSIRFIVCFHAFDELASYIMRVRLEIRHLRLLSAVAGEGSVTGAAKQLHVTQSALSHQLRDAEERLETRLFLRVGKRMVLTPAGNHLVTTANRLLGELAQAEEQVANLNGETAGVIRLSTECYTCYHWLPGLLKKFHAKFPKVEVTIDVTSTRSPVEALISGKLDVAILFCTPKNKNVVLTKICEDQMLLVMGPHHSLAKLRYVRPQDLEGQTVVCYPPREESTLCQKYLRPAGVEPKEVLEVPLTEAVLEMVSAGIGVSLLAHWAIAPYLKSGKVIARPLTGRGIRRAWYAATLKGEPCSPYVTRFVELLSQTCPKALWPTAQA
jgi:LysR family transcriptional regulator, regulator for metE and metH